MYEPIELEDLSADLQATIDRCCDAFESGWQKGESPSISTTVQQYTGVVRRVLLRELLLIEQFYRSEKLGEQLSESEILSSYSELKSEFEGVFPKRESAETMIDGDTHSHPRTGGQMTPVESPRHFENLPVHFGRYQIQKRLGAGSMGTVYLANDTQLERRVALKLPQIHRHSNPQLITRFYREAKAAANLNHPGLCSVYDVDQIDGVHFLTMEFVEGQTLVDALRDKCFSSQIEAAQLLLQVAEAMSTAHENGVIHRDLKPANIMIRPDGTAVVTDFGLAQRSETTQLTDHGQTVGTPAYMSPEQVEGDHSNVGPQSDIYSLGVILFEVLAGRRPFEGSRGSIFGQIMCGKRPSLRDSRSDISPQLESICNKMMDHRLSQRYQSLQGVIQDIRDWVEKERSSLSACLPRSTSWPRLGGALTAVVLLGIVMLIRTSSGTFRITVNDENVSILIDQQRIDLIDGTWSGNQTSGKHELKLLIGEQLLRLGETTSIALDGETRQARVTVSGIELSNDQFEIQRGDALTASVKLEWIEEKKLDEYVSARPAVSKEPLNELKTSRVEHVSLELTDDSYVDFPNFPRVMLKEFTVEGWLTPLARPDLERSLNLFRLWGLNYRDVDNLKRGWIPIMNTSDHESVERKNVKGGQIDRPMHFAITVAPNHLECFVNGMRIGDNIYQDYRSGQRISPPSVSFQIYNRFSHRLGIYGIRPARWMEFRVSQGIRYFEDFTPSVALFKDDQTFALYHFDEGRGSQLTDRSGNGYHGTIFGGKWVDFRSTKKD